MNALPGEGLSTEELFALGYGQLRDLKKCAVTRRGREKALELVTELFLTIDQISRHVGGLSFTERPVHLEDEEDSSFEDRMPLADLLHSREERHETTTDDEADVTVLRERIKVLERSRQDYLKDFLAYFASGCRTEQEITRKVLAVIRRLFPELLKRFGLSQADVARKLGEVRATVSAREKRVVEAPLKAAGARGVLSNGARGAATSQACAKSAKGNRNRAGSKLKVFSKHPNQRTA